MNWPFAAYGGQQQGGSTSTSAQQTSGERVSEEEFKGAEQWFREWRKRRSSGDEATSATSATASEDSSTEPYVSTPAEDSKPPVDSAAKSTEGTGSGKDRAQESQTSTH
jgi:hypothetical protein